MTRYLALALLLLCAFGTHAQTRSWTYDAAGNVLTSTDANGHTTSYTYDGLNRRTSQTDALGVTQQWTYDVAGNVLTHTNRRGIVTATTYDKENRPLEVRRDGLRIATRTYDAAGNLSRSTDANGEATTYTYDAANRKRSEQRPLGHTRQWTYTPWDAIATATDADGYVTTYAYDLRQRLIEQTDPAGATTTHAYDGVGNRTATTRPGGLEWTYAFDAADRLIEVTSPEGATTAYRHDAHGNRTRFTDANHQVTITAYDSRHRFTRIDHPGGTHEEFTYDQEANLATHTDASGRTIETTHDALNRLIKRNYGSVAAGDVQEERWDYDNNGNITRIEQQAGGQIYVTTRSWDHHERLAQETDRHSQTTQWGYDANGNRITRTDAEGTTSTPPDRLNRTTRLTAPDGSATLFAYTPEGRLTTLTHPNGATTEHAYDDAGRIQSIVHRQNGTQVSLTTYTYDARGNRTEETQTDPTGTRTLTYDYDNDDRLIATEETAPDGSTTQTTYTLDATGNRTREQVTQNGVTTKDVSYTYGPRQQLEQSVDAIGGITVTYQYDANGALKEETRNGQTTTYRQNAQDRLATLTLPGAPPIQYAYDAEGRRVEKLTPTEGRRYVWDGTRIRRETNVTGNPLASYEWSSGRILRSQQGSNIAYAQHDALKSPTRWSRQDGGEQGKTRYGAWGTTDSQQGTTPPIGYTGHYQDPETGDYYAQQRYYRPGIGRFTRTDPWEGDPLSPITLNKYLYANGNPLYFTDPTGMYGEAGHYYTTYYVALRVGYSDAEAQQLAVYSQLPDEAAALDAISVQKRRLNNYGDVRRVEWRNAVQVGLHALSGNNAQIETARTLDAIKAAGNDLTTTGLLLHRLGDTFSHRKTVEYGGESDPVKVRMFETGAGHSEPVFAPDTIQRRPELYLDYVETLTTALAQKRGLTAQQTVRLRESVRDELREVAYSSGKLPPGGFATREEDTRLKAQSVLEMSTKINITGYRRLGTGREPKGFIDNDYRPEKFESDENPLWMLDGRREKSIERVLGEVIESSKLARSQSGVYTLEETERGVGHASQLIMGVMRFSDDQGEPRIIQETQDASAPSTTWEKISKWWNDL